MVEQRLTPYLRSTVHVSSEEDGYITSALNNNIGDLISLLTKIVLLSNILIKRQMISTNLLLCMLLALLLAVNCNGFTITRSTDITAVTNTKLYAKKNKDRKSSGRGFGKTETPKPNPASTTTTTSYDNTTNNNTEQKYTGLSSIETTSPQSFTKPTLEIDSNLPTEQRNKEILKQQFGLRSFEEKQSDIKAAEKIAEQRAKFNKIKQMKDEEFDIFMVVPPPILKGVDLFLKTGLAVTTTLFIAAGIGITAEAWAVSTGNKLPEDVDSFIVNVIEPNFTPGLLVLLGFSVSLGIFATAQLGSGSSSYREQ